MEQSAAYALGQSRNKEGRTGHHKGLASDKHGRGGICSLVTQSTQSLSNCTLTLFSISEKNSLSAYAILCEQYLNVYLFCSQTLAGSLAQAKISDPGSAEVLSIFGSL